ncbi:hypothetical protein C3747_60g97 [Trypanosoma cruzi]|uniref:Leucine-rich repeat protein (LRRP) n=2 Tax=Trypanosoma cruzi TaxID=5693 RepID=Q4DBG5_TRYCC|nr:hypothetical protein, conserved [Trypanosoma cruzi]EAN89868.1 hypothetical protein, conserved [Trypanosoma cruzi]PWV11403.1 hypothetical protein C3747_60g97 [Trypanosoma cruzi]RNC44651.1 leucine-richcontaining protein 23 [Trypanosoma cruzi]|eukprot:XP_811719.1 hypothetical protein [Trypanosoma cruzi strain CL Brener]
MDAEENPLAADVMMASLDVLTHNEMGHLVYARSNLSSLRLTSIELLGAYKHLQRISLDDNMLDSLTPLRELRSLVYLSAANNNLTDEVFDDLAPSGTTLERLNLSRNRLASLRGLRLLPFLIDFYAEENQVTELRNEDFSMLHSLTRLNLMSNQIQRVQLDTFAGCFTVRFLNLSHNALEKVQFVMHLANNLESLDLEHNNIKSLHGFDILRELVYLRLANNGIESWEELETLSGLINLRHLTIAGNPILRRPASSSLTKSIPEYSEFQVSADIDFSAGKRSVLFDSLTGAEASNKLVSSMVVPSARNLVKDVTMLSRRLEEWDVDGFRELERLPLIEQHRFRVISILRQLLTIDSVPVSSEEIPRALRLFKKKRGTWNFVGGNILPAGSAARAVESQRAKNGSGMP